MVRSLYSRYPDLAIDVAAEQAALVAADVVVWQSPLYWYGVPALLSLWFEKVLEHGFAYGHEGEAVAGKPVIWVTTAGTPRSWYQEGAAHGRPFEEFTRSVEQTARFCGMRWEPPLVVFGAHEIGDAALAAHARTYRERLVALSRSVGPSREAPPAAGSERPGGSPRRGGSPRPGGSRDDESTGAGVDG